MVRRDIMLYLIALCAAGAATPEGNPVCQKHEKMILHSNGGLHKVEQQTR